MIRTTVELARVVAGLVSATKTEKSTVVQRGMEVAGARHVVQGALTIAVPELRVLGVAVDGLHALSLIAVAAVSGRYRRAALSQAAMATVFALTETAVLRGSRVVSQRAARPERWKRT